MIVTAHVASGASEVVEASAVEYRLDFGASIGMGVLEVSRDGVNWQLADRPRIATMADFVASSTGDYPGTFWRVRAEVTSGDGIVSHLNPLSTPIMYRVSPAP